MGRFETAERVAKVFRSYGVETETKIAQTGTYYVQGDIYDVEGVFFQTLKVRVSGHADAYATSDYSIDDVEGTYAGFVAWISSLASSLGLKKQAPSRVSVDPRVRGKPLGYRFVDEEGMVWEVSLGFRGKKKEPLPLFRLSELVAGDNWETIPVRVIVERKRRLR